MEWIYYQSTQMNMNLLKNTPHHFALEPPIELYLTAILYVECSMISLPDVDNEMQYANEPIQTSGRDVPNYLDIS